MYWFQDAEKKTKINIYPIPQIDEILDQLCKAQGFLKIDFSKAYQWVAVELSHMHKTTFLIKYGLFKSLVLPFGLVNVIEIL